MTLLDGTPLEGIDSVREHLLAYPRFHGVAFDQVDAGMEHVLQKVLDADEVVDAEMTRFVQYDKDIDIALLPCLSASKRTEYAGMQHAHFPEAGAVLP